MNFIIKGAKLDFEQNNYYKFNFLLRKKKKDQSTNVLEK